MSWKKISTIFMLSLLTACSTTPTTPTENQTPEETIEVISNIAKPAQKYTFTLEKQPLGVAIKQIVEMTDANLVLMNGLETYPMPQLEFEDSSIESILTILSEETGCKVQNNESYFFLYAPDYEAITQITLSSYLPPSWSRIKTSAAFGADTPLFNVFALLGYSQNKTLVGDNAIADAGCGEIHLRDTTLTETLEAVLKSARIQQFNFRIKSTNEYVFIHTPGNRLRTKLTTNTTNADLTQRCDIRLLLVETDENKMEGQLGSSRLKDVLPEFSKQLGLPVTAEPAMEKLPVNPFIFTAVTQKAALELLIQQWLLPEFGYDITEKGIHLRYLGPEL